MAENRKVLGQTVVVADTDTTLYTVPASHEAVVSTINICNIGGTERTFRVAIRPAGAAIANQHYLYYDLPIGANDTFALERGITLEATDVITVRANHADVVFAALGAEIDV